MDAKLYLSFIITSFVIAGKVRSEQTLTCKNIPFRNYCIWQRQGNDGTFVDLPANGSKYINHNSAKMTFIKMDISDSGLYRCRLFNVSNESEFSPPIKLCVMDKGTNLTLDCKTFGQNARDYVWDKTSPHLSYDVHKDQSYILHKIQYTDAGTYHCRYILPPKTDWMNSNDTVVVVQGYPEIRFDNHRNKVVIGSSVYMRCTFGETHPSITDEWWTKGYRNARIQTDNVKYETQHHHTGYTSLNVLKVDENDAGEYRCCAKNARGKTCANTTLITGNIPLHPKAAKDVYRVKEGATVSLQCDPQTSIPPITELWWQRRKFGHFRNLTDFFKYSDGTVTTPNLHIRDVRSSEATEYTCNVANVFGNSHVGMEVQLGKPPTVSAADKEYLPIRRRTVTLTCNINNGTRTWWKRPNGKRDIGIDSYKSTGRATSSLTIQNIQAVDDGDYRCYGQNEFGRNHDTITISSGYPPLANISRDFYIVETGNNVNISCVIKNVPERYKASMFWKKGSNYIYDYYYKYNPILTKKNVKLGDAGIYSCHVRNDYGSANDSTELKVLSALIRGQFHEVTANASYTIHCDVFGGDRVIWRKNDQKLKLDNHQIYAGGNVNDPSLEIKKISHLDRGNFTCETSYRSVTAKSTTIQLHVKDIPLVSLSNQIKKVIKGSDTMLDCSYDSYPEPTKVYWKKDDNIIQSSDTFRTKYNGSSVEIPVLVIYDTTQSDSGNYICVVENSVGTGYSKTLQLIIREPEKNVSTAGAIVGGVFATLIAILVVICLVVLFRRRSNNVNNRKPLRQETISNAENVELCTDGRGNRDNGLYLNVARVSTSAAENIKPSTVQILTGDNEYYNLSDVPTSCIRVEGLKQYIEKRQRNEELKNEYKSIPNVAVHPTTHAQTKENMPKNRFKTTFPYDHTRVILNSNGGSDYINANYVDGFEKEKCYIACQGPIKTTVADHWKMIWQENIYQIVMLTNLVEGIKNKCEQYWPSGGKQMVHGNLSLRLNDEKERTAYVTREITIENKKTNKKRKVTQYHFTAWPDHGTPDPLYLVLFHRHVMSDTKSGHSGPLLVHCSAGIGRTGTYIALDALFEEGRTTEFLDIFKFLKKMRYSRMNMIQTPDQYVCLHYALLEAFTMKETKIRKDVFSEVWTSILTDKRPVNHQRLDEEFKMLNAKKDDQNHNQYNAAMSTTNLAKNRNKDVLPMDDMRVYLVSHGKGRSDYINAVQVPSYTKFVGYITTQLPLPDTKVDFWTMIRDHSSSTIVLIINHKKEADLVYSQSDDIITIGQFSIKISARKVEENDITEATIVLSKKDEKPRQVVLFQAICSSIPDPAVLCKLADLISTRATMSNDPITIVSSDGAKNCGLFCAFTNAVSSMQIDNNADIFQLVRLLQLRRPEFFTDFKEYKRCYEALYVHLESANVYANF